MNVRGLPLNLALLAFGLPSTCLIAFILLAPLADQELFGIRGSIWCLFACSPLTAGCLHLCNRLIAAAGWDDQA